MYIPQLRQFFDINGDPLAGGLFYVYAAGTSESLAVYSNQARSSAITQPITIDANGRFTTAVYLPVGTAAKVRCQDSAGVLQWELDNVYGGANFVDNMLRRLSGLSSPRDFGAAGDGATDDRTAIQAAIDDANVSVIDLEGKTYYCSNDITLASNKTLRNGTIKFDGATANKPSLIAAGAVAENRTITTATTGSQTVTLADVSGISTGDLVGIRSAETFGARTWSELFRVEQVSGSDVIVDGVILGTYTTGKTFSLLTVVRDIVLEDLTIIGEGGDELVYFSLCERITVRNCVFKSESSTTSDVRFHSCYDIIIDGCSLTQHTTTGAVDGFAISGASKHVTISDCRIERAKGGVDIGNAFDGSVLGCCSDVVVVGCHFQWCEQAIVIGDGGWHTTVMENTILGDTTAGAASIYSTAPQTVVMNNHIRNAGGDGIGIALAQNADYIVITGNTIKGGTGPGDGIAIDGANTYTCDVMAISGNTIDAMAAGINVGSTAVDAMAVQNNSILTDNIDITTDAIIDLMCVSGNYVAAGVSITSIDGAGGAVVRQNTIHTLTFGADPHNRCVTENILDAESVISQSLYLTNDGTLGNDTGCVYGGNLMFCAGSTSAEAIRNQNGRNQLFFANAIIREADYAVRHTGADTAVSTGLVFSGNVMVSKSAVLFVDTIAGSDQNLSSIVVFGNSMRNTNDGGCVYFFHDGETPSIDWVTIVGNVLDGTGNTRDCIELSDANQIAIVGNVIDACNYGVDVSAAGVTNDVVVYNSIQNHTGGAINGTPDVSASNDTA